MAILEKTRNFIKNMTAPPGTIIQFGEIDWEGHNKRWSIPLDRYEDIRNMMRDPIIKGMLRAWKLPDINAGGRIEPASDSSQDKKIAEFVEDVFWGGKTSFDFNEFKKDLLRYNEFGFRVSIRKTEIVGNQIYWQRFIPLQPESIVRWFTDKDFNIRSIGQEQAFNSNTQQYEDHLIDIKSVFYIGQEVEGSNFEGESVLAAVYGAWWRKQKFLKWKGIQAERGAVGIPRGTLSRNAKDAEKTLLRKVLKGLRGSNEEGYVMDAEGAFAIDFIGGKEFMGIDLRPHIADENKEMVEALNAGFLQQSKGDSPVGSFAKQGEDISFFKLGVAAQQKFSDSVINNGYLGSKSIVKELVDRNFTVTEYPKYVSNDAYEDDVQKLFENYKSGKESGALTITNDDEEFIRERAKMPDVELPEERVKPIAPIPPQGDDEEPEDEKKQNGQLMELFIDKKKRGKKVTPELKRLEKKIDVMSMRDELMRREELAQKEIEPFIKDTRDQLVKKATSIITKSVVKKKSIKEVERAILLQSIPNRTKMTNAVIRHARDMFVFGRARVKLERDATKNAFADILDDLTQAKAAITPTIRLTMDTFFNTLKNEWSDVILAQSKAGIVDTQAIKSRLERVSDKKFKNEVNKKLGEAFGSGRNGQLKAHGTEKVIRSEVLDENTCDPCFGIDGEVIVVDSARWAEVSRGVFDGCKGGDNCRGVNLEWNE